VSNAIEAFTLENGAEVDGTIPAIGSISNCESAAESGPCSPAFTNFQSIFSSVGFIWAEFLFKPSGAARAPRAQLPRIDLSGILAWVE
jgi:hypothetical protein